MANTPFLDLVKPAGTDRALVSVINSNSDKIDTGVSTLSEQMGKTNIHIDVSSQTYNNVTGATALFNALPTQFKGTCYATFTSGYNAVCLVDKHSATYGSIIYEVDWDVSPFHFVMKNGTATLKQLVTTDQMINVVNLSTNLSIDYADAETIGYRTTESTKVDIRNLQGFPTGKTIVCAYPRGYDDIYGAYLWVDNSLYLRGTSKTSKTVSVTITVFYK